MGHRQIVKAEVENSKLKLNTQKRVRQYCHQYNSKKVSDAKKFEMINRIENILNNYYN